MSPEYFHKYLTFQEADDYLYGLNRRYHTNWECARWQTTYIAKCAGNKNYHAPKFGWEQESHDHDDTMVTAEELEAMKKSGANFAKILSGKKK